VSLSAKAFFDRAEQAQRRPPKTFFYLPNIEYLATKEGQDVFYSVWMGYNGTTAHTHYDIFNNFNVQLYGRKRYILTPPTEWAKMYLFPRHHPSCR
jgi:ribosomal protein L16 Arg81 hydroxylase